MRPALVDGVNVLFEDIVTAESGGADMILVLVVVLRLVLFDKSTIMAAS